MPDFRFWQEASLFWLASVLSRVSNACFQREGDMTREERRLLRALARVCAQYMSHKTGGLDHMYMAAGEDAVEILTGYGLVDARWDWTQTGHELLDSDE